MTSRAPLLGSAALACLIVLTGCGDEGGSGDAAGATAAPGVTVTSSTPDTPGPTATTGETAGTEYGLDHRTVTVEPGKEFSLTVREAATLGENWYLADPKPDEAVLKYRGDREKGDGSDLNGSTGDTRSYDFTALAKGRTTVRLLHCPLDTCTGPGPDDRSSFAPTPDGTASPSPYPTRTGTTLDAHAGFYVFTITVR